MQVPLTIADHLERAALVYPDRIGVVDEPDQPAPSWGSITYTEVARRARAQAAGLDELGVAHGDRVPSLSARTRPGSFSPSFFGVSGWGRILVPVNFRLNPVGDRLHRRALRGRPRCWSTRTWRTPSSGIEAKHTYVLGAESDDALSTGVRHRAGPMGRPTRTPRPPSTTRAAPPPAPRACRSPTATSGPTRPSFRMAPRRVRSRTSTCTRCRCSTATAGACPMR